MKKKKFIEEFEEYLEEQLSADAIDSADEGVLLGYYGDYDE